MKILAWRRRASKAAVVSLTKSMALELTCERIRVNALAPGHFPTEINEAHWQTEAGKRLIAKIPFQRLGAYPDLEGALLLLASGAFVVVHTAPLVEIRYAQLAAHMDWRTIDAMSFTIGSSEMSNSPAMTRLKIARWVGVVRMRRTATPEAAHTMMQGRLTST